MASWVWHRRALHRRICGDVERKAPMESTVCKGMDSRFSEVFEKRARKGGRLTEMKLNKPAQTA